MIKVSYKYFLLVFILLSCQDDDVNLFDKSPAERAAEAINNLKAELVAPANGWKLNYKPVEDAGSYYVLMKFNEDNTVYIQTDLPADDGKYFTDTITYRIDNSVTLELIFESYTFFSYLFEQDQASFGAEFMFHYQNKSEGNLIFVSKSDLGSPTIAVFEEAGASDENLLGKTLARNLNTIQEDVGNLTTTFKVTYKNKDLALQLSLDALRRIISINAAIRKSNPTDVELLSFTSPYIVEGDAVIFDESFSDNLFGTAIELSGFSISELQDNEIDLCGTPKVGHLANGSTSAGDAITLEGTLQDFKGRRFANLSDFYIAPPNNFIDNGTFGGDEVTNDLPGVLAAQLYYNNGGFYAIGFVLQKTDGSIYFALQEFTPVLEGNVLKMEFTTDVEIYNTTEPEVNVAQVKKYIDLLTQGGSTYVFEYAESLYEFYNPCSGWSIVFIDANS